MLLRYALGVARSPWRGSFSASQQKQCAEFAAEACPFVSGKKLDYSDRPVNSARIEWIRTTGRSSVKYSRNRTILLLKSARPRGTHEEKDMDMEKLLTKEKADAICGQIAKGLEENKIVGSTNVIAYAMKQSWLAGFEEGRKYPLTESK